MNKFSKQPTEQYVIQMDYTDRLPAGSVIASALVHATILDLKETTLAAAVIAGATTVSLTGNPGQGAELKLSAGVVGSEEVSKVTAVTGTGPYTCTLAVPAVNGHQNAAKVSYSSGGSVAVLESTTGVVVGAVVKGRVKGGINPKQYKIWFLAILDTGGDRLEDDVFMTVLEE